MPIGFPIHYLLLTERDLRALFADVQTKWLFVLFALGVAGLTVQNLVTPQFGRAFAGEGDVLRGLDVPVHQRSHVPLLVGTHRAVKRGQQTRREVRRYAGRGGGFYRRRHQDYPGYTIDEDILWQFSQVVLPASAVVSVELDDRVLDREGIQREFSGAAIVSILWLVILLTSSLVKWRDRRSPTPTPSSRSPARRATL